VSLYFQSALKDVQYSDVDFSLLHSCDRSSNKFLFNNQPDASITQIYCYKTPHVSGIFSAHHQEFSTVHSALVSFMEFHPDSAWEWSSNLHETYQCRMYSRKILKMGREDTGNM